MEQVITENEQKKEYLNQYRNHVRKIKRIESEIEEIREMKCYPSVNNDGMPRGSNNSDLSGYAALLDEKERELERERYLRVKSYSEISKQIDLLESDIERDVLHYRYIKGLAWWRVAEELECSEREVYRKHGKALNNFKIPETCH